MQGRREQLLPGVERGTRVARLRRQRRLAMLTAYIEATGPAGSRTGLLIARRTVEAASWGQAGRSEESGTPCSARAEVSVTESRLRWRD